MRVDVQARPREVPLTPCVVIAEGTAAKALLRLLLDDVARIAALQGVVHQAGDVLLLALVGHETDLPWVEGVSYFGIDPSAPRLRLSTTLAAHLEGASEALAAQLLEAALMHRHGEGAMPMLVMPERLISLAAARPLDLQVLRSLEAKA
jgi:MoxR-vWA-beta-propeller ternary system domain bpX5